MTALRDKVRSWYGSNVPRTNQIAERIRNGTGEVKRKYDGLSFGDRLNCALFCLTILSLGIAFGASTSRT
jgi:hypothetical protein